jgi:hypothetical protein
MNKKIKYKNVLCQYCQEKAIVIQGKVIYGETHKLSDLEFYYCEPCAAWVGMHKHNKKPFGTLANNELRRKRAIAHKAFDVFWRGKENQAEVRKAEYAWLADVMGVAVEDCHIGMFNIEQCNKVITTCLKRLGK